MERWYYLLMSNSVILSLVQNFSKGLGGLKGKVAAAMDDKSLTERQRFIELEEMKIKKEAELDAALTFLDNYDCNSAYLDNLYIVTNYIEEQRSRKS